jgi:hypothetical protein
MEEDVFIITFIRGKAKDLNKSFVRTEGTEAVIATCEENYDFLYNSMLEKANDEERRGVK